MNETDFEESQAQRFATLSRWKRWLANVGILDGRVLLMSDAERQKMRTENLRRLAARPLWEKWIAIAGLAAGAISVALYPYLFGRLTIGWEKLGFTRTIVPSGEPILFIATLLFFEGFFLCLVYFLTRVYFFRGNDGSS
ncbi:hypothetical protein [Bradyrhizobium barranii]|jgi:hypothetical protein|uniref:hypothetical protein n=1 Tax=Bradyrhizobium TaxID=374 RepID=UPI0024AFE98F|nr:hypothetical protein [Bradyrhizobium barranii]WFT91892.1 hypothetical protein QA633_26455 [Bradyrhizobium barranii]